MNISILLYGKPGVGKSVLVNTFPKALIFDFDNGHKLYKKHFPENKIITEQDGDMFEMLQGAVKQIEEGTFKYETIVIDSLTNAENKAVANAKGMNKSNWAQHLYTGKGKALSYQDWGGISGSTIALLTYMRNLPINLVVITQIDTTYDNGRAIFKPNLIGKGSDEALHFADVVGYMELVSSNEGKQRFLHLNATSDDNFYAKARLLQGYVEPLKNPSYEKLMAIIDNDKLDLDFK